MRPAPRATRRRLLIGWLALGAAFAAAVGADLLDPALLRWRVLGFDLGSAVRAAGVLAALAACVTALRWLRSLPRRTKRITVRQLRRQARHRG